MKRTLIFCAVLLAASSFGQQLSVKRKYVVGDKDAYKVTIGLELPQGHADLVMRMDQTVKKVYENGEADIATAISESKVLFMGQEVPASQLDVAATVQRFQVTGQPVGGLNLDAKGGLTSLTQIFTLIGPGLLEVGKPVNLDAAGAKDTSGTVLLESIVKGVANVTSDIKFNEKSKGNMRFKSKTQIDVATSKLVSASADITGIASLVSTPGMEVDSISIKLQRIDK